jgi:hypothetical protein
MSILDIVLLIVIVAWLAGFSLNIAGSLVHLLLVLALIILIARLLGIRGHRA